MCEWISSKLVTLNKVGVLYGRMSVRLKGAQGVGTWPAFWTLGANIGKIGWPRCGEIDVVELAGYTPTTVWGTPHGPATGGGGAGRASGGAGASGSSGSGGPGRNGARGSNAESASGSREGSLGGRGTGGGGSASGKLGTNSSASLIQKLSDQQPGATSATDHEDWFIGVHARPGT